MKTVILYESKYGMTKKIANIMVRHRTKVHLFKISEFDKSLEDYDEVIIGTPIYAGRINKKVKKFLEQHQPELLEKITSIFLCGMAHENEQQVIDMNFTKEMINHAKIKYAGGAYQFSKMNWLFKMIVKKISKSDQDQEKILEDNIQFLLK